MPDPLAQLRGASACYDANVALNAVDIDLPEGRIIALCGPNGSGKSTALRVMRGLHAPAAGQVEVAGRPISDWTARDLALQIAMLSQSPEAPGELSVSDLVLLGRFAHRGRFGGVSKSDTQARDRALAVTELEALRDRPIGQLSGGQLQRAWIAMTLAQDAPRIFLDEPTNHLDIAHAFEVLDLLRWLNRSEARGIVVVLHDLNMAMRYADHVVLFDKGRIAAQGATREVMTEITIERVFGIRCRLVSIPGQTLPTLVPLPKSERAFDTGQDAAE
ncbi:iron complex transport system ATP-binding protein [Poseidonocella pacifica]|uniref:Iron complex transport system ATP-binding protein n=1 Tax=Poseidonocella pacifica TaxID=871651 RepID=A0A1I0YJQ8_9RHOB|nr:ABC transporter ATP-binding protein [Poseidonocella pacifica]SFB13412.1 iron complex transport system ATP-binding protein [Poseidonocella pacifica]